jgi:hypothetical protein
VHRWSRLGIYHFAAIGLFLVRRNTVVVVWWWGV